MGSDTLILKDRFFIGATSSLIEKTCCKLLTILQFLRGGYYNH